MEDGTVEEKFHLSSDYRVTVLGKLRLISSFFILGEIVETCGFNSDNTYVFFDTFLPDGWRFEEDSQAEMYSTIRDQHAEPNKR